MKRLIKKLSVILLWSIVSLYMAIAMLPKAELYYQAEHLLKKYNVYINKESVSDGLLFFNINNADIAYTDIDAAKIDNISISTFIFYNSVTVSPFSIKESLSGFIPPKVKFIKITNSILRPHIVALESEGDFGKASGYADLLNRKIYVDFAFSSVISTKYRQMLKVLKKTKEGYAYESSF